MLSQGLKIVIFCPQAIESGKLAGPNIRSVEIARRLARQFDVTLALPAPTDYFQDEPFQTRLWSRHEVRRWIGEYDVALSLGTQYSVRSCLAAGRKNTVQIFDLYDPVLFAILASDPHLAHEERIQTRFLGRLTALLLKRADYVLCASPQQRDLWLGALYVAREFTPGKAQMGPEEMIGIVPFGHGGGEPVAEKPVLKGVHPGIEPEDKVLLWGGGIWNWFDPLTLLKAMELIAAEREDVKLLFLATQSPDSSEKASGMAREAIIYAREKRLLGKQVFFNEAWVPFEKRAGYLLESDLAVCTAPEGLENSFAFRTRLVDAVWAGLPIVCTRGNFMADFVETNQVGLSARAHDPGVLKEKILAALEPGAQKRFRENMAGSRDQLEWDRCVKPLVEFCERVETGEYQRPRESYCKAWRQYLGYKIPSVVERIFG